MNSSVKNIASLLNEWDLESLESLWPRVKEFIAQELWNNLDDNSFLVNNQFVYKISTDWELTIIDKESLDKKVLLKIDSIWADVVQDQVYNCIMRILTEAGIIKECCWVDYLEQTSTWLDSHEWEIACTVEEAVGLTDDDIDWLTEYRVFHDKYIIVIFHDMIFFMSWWELQVIHEWAWVLALAEKISLSVLMPDIVCDN